MHVRTRRHEKIPARPLLIDCGLAGMGLVLSPIDSGVSGSPFLVLRPPFLVLTQEKEAKESQAPNRGQGSWPGAPRGASQVCRVHD